MPNRSSALTAIQSSLIAVVALRREALGAYALWNHAGRQRRRRDDNRPRAISRRAAQRLRCVRAVLCGWCVNRSVIERILRETVQFHRRLLYICFVLVRKCKPNRI